MGGNVICRCRGAGFDQRRASIAIDLSFSMAIRRQRQRQHQQQQQQQQQQRQQQDRSNKTTIKPRKESAPLSMISLINLCLEVTFYRLIQVLCNESDSKFQCRGLIRPPPPVQAGNQRCDGIDRCFCRVTEEQMELSRLIFGVLILSKERPSLRFTSFFKEDCHCVLRSSFPCWPTNGLGQPERVR